MTPAVVLVRPEIPENIGFVARTLACFGWADLRLVGNLPATSSPAWRTVSGGDGVLEKAQAFTDLPTAVADCHRVLGFSRRPHRDAAIHDLGDVTARLPSQAGGKLALVFGPESQGLSSADGDSITDWVRIATPHPTMSLNLSHAVAIAVHRFAEAMPQGLAKGVGNGIGANEAPLPANRDLMEIGWEHLSQALQDKKALHPSRAEAQIAQLRALWNRMTMTQDEAEFLFGILKKLCR